MTIYIAHLFISFFIGFYFRRLTKIAAKLK